MDPSIEPTTPPRNRELEGLATGVELTLASVLQGIPMATLVPGIVELILAGDIARFLYAPASLLIIFIVWVIFVVYALSYITWPFDPIHNLIYFLVVTAESVLLGLIDRPGVWFLALIGLALIFGLNSFYNQRQIQAQSPLYRSIAERALHNHIVAEQAHSLRFVTMYLVVGVLGAILVPVLETIGVAQGLVWALASLGALAVPVVHVFWLIRLVRERSHLIEASQLPYA
jgi:hypothetical protein